MIIWSLFGIIWIIWFQIITNKVHIIWWLLDDYLMIIWWLFDLFDQKVNHWDTTHPILPGYVVSKYQWSGLHAQKADIRFVGFIAARRSLCIFMSAVTIIRTQVCALANESPLQFLHLKLRNRSVCWLCVWLFWMCICRLSNSNRSVWASLRCFTLSTRELIESRMLR